MLYPNERNEAAISGCRSSHAIIERCADCSGSGRNPSKGATLISGSVVVTTPMITSPVRLSRSVRAAVSPFIRKRDGASPYSFLNAQSCVSL